MTERGFPEQRNRCTGTPESAAGQRRAEHAPAHNPLVFDEAFVLAAPVKEPSARIRMLEARRAAEAAPPRPQPEPWRMDRQPTARWTVKPSHRLTSMRLAALLWLAGAVSGTALLISLLR